MAGKEVSATAEVAKVKPPRKIKTRAPRYDDSIALQQVRAELKLCQAEVARLNGELWNRGAGDGALGTAMAVITTLDAIFAKAQVEKCWGDASKELVERLILTLSAAVAAANVIKGHLSKAETTGAVH